MACELISVWTSRGIHEDPTTIAFVDDTPLLELTNSTAFFPVISNIAIAPFIVCPIAQYVTNGTLPFRSWPRVRRPRHAGR